MFGGDMIIGISEQSLDNKNRIILPKFTGASYEDELVLFQEEDNFSVYHMNYLIQKLGLLEKNELLDLKSFLVLKRRYDEIMSNVFAKCSVDRQKRILLPQLVVDYYQLSHSVIIRGAIDHVNVFKADKTKSYVKKKSRV